MSSRTGNLAPKARSMFDASTAQFAGLVERLQSKETLAMAHDDLESLVESQGKELMRSLIQDHLRLRAEREEARPAVEGADGVLRGQVRERTRGLMTLFGEVEVERLSYGARGAESLAPMDAELNLPVESFSLGVRKRVAIEAARGSYDDVVEHLAMTTGAKIAKRQVEQLAIRSAVDFESFYAMRQLRAVGEPPATPAGPELLVISTDGKGVVMRKEDLRPETRKAAEREQRKLAHRVSKGERPYRTRMAQVAAVYDIAPFVRRPVDVAFDIKRLPDEARPQRPRPSNKRVWASVKNDGRTVIEDAFAEALARDPQQERRWAVLIDGAEAQLANVLAAAEKFGVKVTVILDVIHVVERLWRASLSFHAEGTTAAEEWVAERFLAVLEGNASGVAAGMRRSATKRRLPASKRKAVDECAAYLLKYKTYLAYDEYLAAGFPIATGIIEGACRHLVGDRMGVTGARWGLTGAEAVLRLRSLRSSGDFEEYWRYHVAQEAKRNHHDKYAGTAPPSAPKLELINGGSS
jgi:hypothetical protein